MFYHRCSQNSEQHRRLCVEKITIGPDGLIPEVPMTSQGVGEPFAPGEPIMGYQACGLKGKIYIGLDGIYEESLQGIANGDEAVFRYVKSEEGFTSVTVTGSGKGKAEVYLNGKPAGTCVFDGDEGEIVKKTAVISVPAGQYEVALKFHGPESLKIYEVVLA